MYWTFLSDEAVQIEINKMSLLDRYARMLYLDMTMDYLMVRARYPIASEIKLLHEIMQHPLRIERRRIALTCFQECMDTPHKEMMILLKDARQLARGLFHAAFYMFRAQEWIKSHVVLQEELEREKKKKMPTHDINAKTETNAKNNIVSSPTSSSCVLSVSSSTVKSPK
jgi:hypothetical protein